MIQQVAAYSLVALAAGWLLWRYAKRRATGNCCGEAECPAAKVTAKKLGDLARRR
ncbi:MAG TPA: hypothetical protein VFY93_17890 [Planctomycetota bacterium]|nr:hypothetical protein [Planctomycetota bacterium]